MDVVYANGDRSVPVRNRRYSSVGGVGVRCDFRKVVHEASGFAGSSAHTDQADEKVRVVVFVCGDVSGGVGHGQHIAGIVIGIGCRFAVGKRDPDQAVLAVVGVVRSVSESVRRRILRALVVVRLALGVSGGIDGL